MTQSRSEIVAWVGSHIVPHEVHLRAWLRGMSISEDEVNDIVQDAYVLIARLPEVSHIRNSRAYLFQTAKTVFLNKIRRSRIVPIGQLTELEAASLSHEDPDPERHVSARQELNHVMGLIGALPDKCRVIFEMRRIQGLSQKEIARRLGVSENVVEMQAVRGLKLILASLQMEEPELVPGKRRQTETKRERERDS